MTPSELMKKLFLAFSSNDNESFEVAAREYIEREKRKKHTFVARELESALYTNGNSYSHPKKNQNKLRNIASIPRDADKGFPLFEIQHFDHSLDSLLISNETKEQLEQVMREYKNSDVLATYNLQYKKKVLLCGKPGTGKTFSAQIMSSVLKIPLVYIRFDAIISSFLGETAGNLRKVFDFIEQGMWIVLFDEFDIIGKHRDDSHEHGEIKRVVNNFLQMLDNSRGDSIILAATNHQHMLDPAIWRRFDDVIYYNLPDEETRVRLFDIYLRPIKRDRAIDLQALSIMTKGLSPADIKMIVEEAMKAAIIDSRGTIAVNDLEKAVNKFIKREKVRNNKMGDLVSKNS
jgi:SpoVK/Ycf46/Vps4 family AAA+-type ATPase